MVIGLFNHLKADGIIGLQQEGVDTFHPLDLYPFTQVKAVYALRVGILTIFQKWEFALQTQVLSFSTCDISNAHAVDLALAAHILPTAGLISCLQQLQPGDVLQQAGQLIAIRFGASSFQLKEYPEDLIAIHHIEDLFTLNAAEICSDFKWLTESAVSETLSETNQVLGDRLFVGQQVQAESAVFNTKTGPIYIDDGAEIMEGALLRGPLYIGRNAVVKMGTQLYGNVSIGHGAVVGGEISHSIIGDHAAKGHFGYLGCSVIGDYCNLGAGSTNSNLKNNLSAVNLYDYRQQKYRNTGMIKCGLFMGDYSRVGIQSAFNTGTVIGVGCMLADTQFYPRYLPNFTWYYNGKQENYQIDKFIANLEVVFSTKAQALDESTKELLRNLRKL